MDNLGGLNSRTFEIILPQSAVEAALQSVAERVNYGLEQGQYGLSKPPAALCVWRWEVKDTSLLPCQIRDKAESRKLERLAVRGEIKSLLEPMSPEERALTLGLKSVPSKPFSGPSTSTNTVSSV
jgi:chromatin assembly factor 1 subunit A